MTRRQLILAAVVGFLLAGALARSQQPAPAPAADRPAAQRWEYLSFTNVGFPSLKTQMWLGSIDGVEIAKETSVLAALNAAGTSGWELLTVISDHAKEPYYTTFYFKRPAR